MKIKKLEELEWIGGVLVHGCFDMLHLGHLRMIDWAKSLGSPLTVTITADKYFPEKGKHRPAFPQEIRAEWLSHIENIDHVAIVHEPTAVTAIRIIKPEIFCKGENKLLNIEELALNGIRLAIYPDGHLYSSTNILSGKYLEDK